MHKDLEALCSALDALAAAVKGGWNGDQTFNEAWGWNCPTVTRHDMAAVAGHLAQDIRDVKPELIDAELLKLVQDYPRRLQVLQSRTVPQFWGGNNGIATSVYLSTIETMRESLVPLIGWQLVPDSKSMPKHISRRLRSIQAEIEQLVPKKDELATQIENIEQAHAAAESLPLDLKELSEARERVVRLASESATSAEKARTSAEQADEQLRGVTSRNEEAQKLVARCEEAYRITTTKGLAAAFDLRASRLARSMWVWVGGLLAALVAGSYIGSAHIQQLSLAISAPNPQWGAVWLHTVLSIVGIGAPVWFAWLATKQIGQRFRLAEDYAFKASVAKAYEGYRKEAARIDSTLEARLFGSALDRLDEAPLRLIEHEAHGSPWHEFFSSPAFQRAISTMPELKDSFIESMRRGVSSLRRNPTLDEGSKK